MRLRPSIRIALVALVVLGLGAYLALAFFGGQGSTNSQGGTDSQGSIDLKPKPQPDTALIAALAGAIDYNALVADAPFWVPLEAGVAGNPEAASSETASSEAAAYRVAPGTVLKLLTFDAPQMMAVADKLKGQIEARLPGITLEVVALPLEEKLAAAVIGDYHLDLTARSAAETSQGGIEIPLFSYRTRVQMREGITGVQVLPYRAQLQVIGGGNSDQLTIALPEPVASLGQENATAAALQVMGLVGEGLVRPGLGEDQGQAVEPGMAQSWDLSEDGLELVFTLRDSALWSDGTPVVAKDFEAPIRRHLASQPGPYQHLGIQAVEARAENQITLTLAAPRGDILNYLALPEFMPSLETRFNGPYVVESLDPIFGLVLRSNPDYWDQDGRGSSSGPQEIRLRPIADQAVAQVLMAEGLVDILWHYDEAMGLAHHGAVYYLAVNIVRK